MARVIKRITKPKKDVVYRMAVTPIAIDVDEWDTYQLEAFNFEAGSFVVGTIEMRRNSGQIIFKRSEK